ncbi:NEDD8-activating enzyme E1 regulatory subunit [Powellomyces hirtus]|nr:NEDD8-activating enzyme E1 regulatory subunit [Powellomyces hirtus]
MIDKTQKYDRQLRLWHSHGQAALESSKVCLLNGSGVGTEILKNLILPGIGSLMVVDGCLVEESDLGQNFFVTPASVGQSRAKVVSELLLELNAEVEGSHVQRDPAEIIENSPEFFQHFSLVIATQITGPSLYKLADICWAANIPLVIVRAHGLMGYSRIIVREHTVVESHPEQIVDLRFDCPFAALREFAESFNLDELDSMAHSHVPYIVILLKAVDSWKRNHDGKLPSSSADREQFKQSIRDQQRSDMPENQNFNEALASAYRAWTPTTIPSSIRLILNNTCAQNITSETPDFWIIARAVCDFVQNEGQGFLPLPGTVPDMHADTESYIRLQTIYRSKAREDAAAVSERVANLLASIGSSPSRISAQEIEMFCKNAGYLHVIRYRSLAEEQATETARSKTIGNSLAGDPQDNIAWYVMLRAVEVCKTQFQRYPGMFEGLDHVSLQNRDADSREKGRVSHTTSAISKRCESA